MFNIQFTGAKIQLFFHLTNFYCIEADKSGPTVIILPSYHKAADRGTLGGGDPVGAAQVVGVVEEDIVLGVVAVGDVIHRGDEIGEAMSIVFSGFY